MEYFKIVLVFNSADTIKYAFNVCATSFTSVNTFWKCFDFASFYYWAPYFLLLRWSEHTDCDQTGVKLPARKLILKSRPTEAQRRSHNRRRLIGEVTTTCSRGEGWAVQNATFRLLFKFSLILFSGFTFSMLQKSVSPKPWHPFTSNNLLEMYCFSDFSLLNPLIGFLPAFQGVHFTDWGIEIICPYLSFPLYIYALFVKHTTTH